MFHGALVSAEMVSYLGERPLIELWMLAFLQFSLAGFVALAGFSATTVSQV
jgi:hypothetical protein